LGFAGTCSQVAQAIAFFNAAFAACHFRRFLMATIKQTLDELMTVDGAMCASVVDSNSGMMLGSVGSGVDLEMAAAGNTEVVRAKLKTMRSLGLNDVIEDILITLGRQYHIIRPMSRKEGVFIYFVLDKSKANLALARRKAAEVEKDLSF
jgi:predicted regulator of Ras-like GTPase activity (Roadblock/LC7/MglB family)